MNQPTGTPMCECLRGNLRWILLGPKDYGRWYACREHNQMLIFNGLIWRWSDDPQHVEECYARG